MKFKIFQLDDDVFKYLEEILLRYWNDLLKYETFSGFLKQKSKVSTIKTEESVNQIMSIIQNVKASLLSNIFSYTLTKVVLLRVISYKDIIQKLYNFEFIMNSKKEVKKIITWFVWKIVFIITLFWSIFYYLTTQLVPVWVENAFSSWDEAYINETMDALWGIHTIYTNPGSYSLILFIIATTFVFLMLFLYRHQKLKVQQILTLFVFLVLLDFAFNSKLYKKWKKIHIDYINKSIMEHIIDDMYINKFIHSLHFIESKIFLYKNNYLHLDIKTNPYLWNYMKKYITDINSLVKNEWIDKFYEKIVEQKLNTDLEIFKQRVDDYIRKTKKDFDNYYNRLYWFLILLYYWGSLYSVLTLTQIMQNTP